MPEIRIKSCRKTSNADALEAVRTWMYRNYTERSYRESRVIKVKNGNEIYVKEINPKEFGDENPCDCEFEVGWIAK